MAERLNDSIEQLRARFGEIGDQRLTVMAAITLADQHAEAERRLRQIQAETGRAGGGAGGGCRAPGGGVEAACRGRRSTSGGAHGGAGGAGRRRQRPRHRPEPTGRSIAILPWRGPWRRHICRSGEAAGPGRRTAIPGALRSLRELSLSRPVGLSIRRPPTPVGLRDRKSPPTLAASLPSSGPSTAIWTNLRRDIPTRRRCGSWHSARRDALDAR